MLVSLRCGANGAQGPSYARQVVKVDHDLVGLAVCQILERVLVLGLGSPLGSLLLFAPSLRRLIVVHEVVIVVADIIFGYRDVPDGVGEGLLGRGLEVLEEGLEGSWRKSVSGPDRRVATRTDPGDGHTLLLLVLDGSLELTKRHFDRWLQRELREISVGLVVFARSWGVGGEGGVRGSTTEVCAGHVPCIIRWFSQLGAVQWGAGNASGGCQGWLGSQKLNDWERRARTRFLATRESSATIFN